MHVVLALVFVFVWVVLGEACEIPKQCKRWQMNLAERVMSRVRTAVANLNPRSLL